MSTTDPRTSTSTIRRATPTVQTLVASWTPGAYPGMVHDSEAVVR